MTLAPRWPQITSDFNPFKHIVGALQAVFRGEIVTPIVGFGLLLAVVLVVAGWSCGTRVFAA